jgi:hypothetical protein
VKVALRDDDTSYFTRPEVIEALYRDIWQRAPVCLAVVPCAIGYQNPGIPKEHWRSGIAFPLDQNPAIVERLREWIGAGRVTVALHGYTHQDFPAGFEFQAAPDPERRIADGRSLLQRALDTPVSIFVPPHNALSKRGLSAVSAAGLNLLGSFLSFRPSMRPWEWRTIPNFFRVRRVRSATGRRKHDPFVYPYVLRYERHAEFACHSLVPGTTAEQLIQAFDEARALGGDFCVATHYWEIDAVLHSVLRRFLDYTSRFSDVRFVTAEELFT